MEENSAREQMNRIGEGDIRNVAAADGGPWKKKVVILAKMGSVVATMRSFARNSDRLNNSSREIKQKGNHIQCIDRKKIILQ